MAQFLLLVAAAELVLWLVTGRPRSGWDAVFWAGFYLLFVHGS